MIKTNFNSAKTSLFIGILFLAALFVYTEKVLDPVFVPRIIFFSIVLIPFLVYLIISVNKRNTNTAILSNALVWIYLGYALLSGVSVIVSINPGEGIWEFLRVCLFLIFFICGALLLQDVEGLSNILPKIFIPFSAIILGFGIYQLVDVLQNGPLDHQTSYLINSVFAHRNLFSQMLFFTIPFLMMGIFYLKSLWRIMAIILLTLALILITLTLVKSVWLALIVATVFSLVILLFFRKSIEVSFPIFKRILTYLFAAVLVILISVAVYSRFSSIETFEKQTYVIKNYKFGSAIERVHLWEKSVEMFKDNPVIGIGAGNWRIYLPHYGTGGMRSAEGEIIYQRPHNDFLWVLSEKGFITFVFYILLFIITVFYLIRIIQKSPSIQDKYFAFFLLFFVIGYGIIASLSFPAERPMNSLVLNLVFILTLVQYHKINTSASEIRTSTLTISGIVAVAFLLLTIYVGIKRFGSELHTKNAFTYRVDGEWKKVIDEIDQAESFFSKLDPTATPLRWYSGLAWYNLGNMQNATIDFQKAFDANPYHMHVLNNLATIYGKHGDYKTAIKYYTEAVRISPDFTDAAFNLSATYYNVGQTDSAYRILKEIKNGSENPNYKNIVSALVYDKVENLKESVDDKDLLVTLTRIRNSNDWMVKVHEQALFDKISLNRHLIIESLYMLEVTDQTIDSTRAAYLRKKYLED